MYKNNPTAGSTNGVLVSEGTHTEPISTGVLRADLGAESAPIKLAVRCNQGYEVQGDTTISLVGEHSSQWRLALDNNGNPGSWFPWGASIILANVKDVNVIFWAKARTSIGELPLNDRTVQIRTRAVITQR